MTYDVIIAGGGSAGAVVAARFSEDSHSDACSLVRRLTLMLLGSLSCRDNDLEHISWMGQRRGMTGSDLTGGGPYSLGHEAL